MNLLKAFLALGLVVSTAACSNSGSSGGEGGKSYKPADPAASKAVTTSFAALQQFQERKTGRTHALRKMMQSSVEQQDVQALSNKLNQKVNNKDCVFKLPSEEAPTQKPPQNGPNFNVDDMFFEISGDKCPMTAFIKVHGNGDPQNIQVRFEMSMTVKSADLQNEMNITEASFSGDLKGALVQLGETAFQMNMRGLFSGRGATVSHGPFSSTTDVTMEMKISMPQQREANMPVDLFGLSLETRDNNSYIFSDSRTDFSSHQKLDGQTQIAEYFINGQPVKAEEYAKYASQISIPGMDQGPGGNEPKPQIASFCELLAFDSVRYPQSYLEQVMNAKNSTSGLIPMASARVTGCGKTAETFAFVNGQQVMMQIGFHEYSNSAVIEVAGVSQNFALQPDFQDFITATVNGVSMVYACQPVPSCN